MKIEQLLNGKKILIWGYGREGKATESFINNYCKPEKLEVFEGRQNEIDESQFDLIIKSPGIVPEHLNEKYTSQTELFLNEFAGQTIGITGTKGKSTTSSMLYQVLSACQGKKVLLMGNIGLPCLNYYGEIDQDTIIVFEMSCHQLSHIKVSPHIAIFLNLYEDHLDYYKTMENYFGAKKNITLNQGEGDFLYIGQEVPEFETRAAKSVISYDLPTSFEMKLKGSHNQYNAMFVYKICTERFGCNGDEVRKAIAEFTGLHHRLEFVANDDGVDYYNDSISTIPEATIQAANSIKNAKTILVGGMDRGIHYGILVDFIKEHQELNFILSYESGKRIFEDVKTCVNCCYVEDLAQSVKCAKEITEPGGAVILSPAAASYGYFKNFEERGDAFKKLVSE